MESGLDVAESQARMKMAGEDAITAFSSLASAIGMELSPQLKDLMEDTESLVGIVDENEEFFDRLFGEDVQAMIDAVAAGIGDIFEELEKDRDPLKFAFTGIDPEGNVHTTDMAQRSAADLISIWDSAPSMWGNNQQMPGFDSNFWKTVDFSEMYGPPNVNVDVAVNIAEGRTTVDTTTGVFANQKEAEADSKKTSTTVPRSAYNHRSGAGGWGGRFGW